MEINTPLMLATEFEFVYPRLYQMSETIVDTIQGIMTSITYPILEEIYRNGPHLYGYGFWEGRSETDICATLTNLPSTSSDGFWKSFPNSIECQNIIRRKLKGFCVGVNLIALPLILLMMCLRC